MLRRLSALLFSFFAVSHYFGISNLSMLQNAGFDLMHSGPCDSKVIGLAGQEVQNSLPQTFTCSGGQASNGVGISLERYERDTANPGNGTYFLKYWRDEDHGEIRYYYVGATQELDSEGLTHN